MKKILLLMALFLVAVCVLFTQNRPRLAILPFTGSNAEDAESIAEFFSFESAITRNFFPVPRTRAVENLMREQQFQRSGLTDADTIAELGRQLNADYVVAGHITSLGASRLLLITIIHVEQLQQIAGDYREYRRIEETETFLPAMAQRIVEAALRDTSQLPRLAVLPFNVLSSEIGEGDAEVLAQILATDIANGGKYAVFPRTKAIEKVMEEHDIQRSGMTDAASIHLIGTAVNAQYVLSANVRSLGANKYFSAAILHIESGGQDKGSRKQYQDVSDGLKLMTELAGELTGITVAGTSPAPATTTPPAPATVPVRPPHEAAPVIQPPQVVPLSERSEWYTNTLPAGATQYYRFQARNDTDHFIEWRDADSNYGRYADIAVGVKRDGDSSYIVPVSDNGNNGSNKHLIRTTPGVSYIIEVKGFDSTESGTYEIRHQSYKTYQIGERGPAGGIVFYDKGNFSDGWRYLEAAPADTEIKNLRWGAYGKDVTGTRTDLGAGKSNTQIIIQYLRGNNESGRAAQVCAQLNTGGFTDWFLPSREELQWMFLNLHKKGFGGFKNERYWSSSQVNANTAWYLHFGEDGRASNTHNKNRDGLLSIAGEIWTRAARSF